MTGTSSRSPHLQVGCSSPRQSVSGFLHETAGGRPTSSEILTGAFPLAPTGCNGPDAGERPGNTSDQHVSQPATRQGRTGRPTRL